MISIYGILAHPAGHSLSPALHNAAFQHLGIPAEYRFFDITAANLADFMDVFRSEEAMAGLSVSLPHKQAIMSYLDDIDETAGIIGAVNTVQKRKEGLFGTNTDWLGALQALEERVDLLNKRVVVFGASGAARAVIYALRSREVKVTILNRTVEKAQKLAQEFGCQFGGLDQVEQIRVDIAINCTSVGLESSTGTDLVEGGSSLVSASWWQPGMIAFDTVYKPVMTTFLRDAHAGGAEIITGEKMLLYQGVHQFELWTQQKAPVDIMRQALMQGLKK